MNKKNFSSERSLNSHMEDEFGITLELDSSSNDMDFDLIETAQSFIVGYLAHDSSPQDFFESDDGAGTFIEFSNVGERDKKMAELNKTKKLFYLVDKYDHSQVHYSIAETANYPDKQWDVTPGKAVFIPCDDIQGQYKKMKKEKGEAIAFKEFIKDSNITLDQYSNWCNGDVYGYQIILFDKKGQQLSEDSCWGYIGSDYANQEKNSIMKGHVEKEEIEKISKNVEIENLSKDDIKNLPFKIMKKGLETAQITKVYDTVIIAAKYEGEDKSVIYNWNPNLEKPIIAKFEQWQKNHGTTPEQFLSARMKSDINEAIRTKIAEQNQTQTLKA